MNTVRLEVKPLADVLSETAKSMESGVPAANARIAFASTDLLWQVLTAKRWDILRAMAGAGPMPLREAARRVARDVKAVHGDVHALLDAGILDKTEDGKIVFPYDTVHVDFMLKAA
ncbi:MAG: DNA-binding protein [Betaproteobacteria bacterium]|nr:DNA-binding protein [Betaproteobacteria bacterium]